MGKNSPYIKHNNGGTNDTETHSFALGYEDQQRLQSGGRRMIFNLIDEAMIWIIRIMRHETLGLFIWLSATVTLFIYFPMVALVLMFAAMFLACIGLLGGL